MAQNQALKKYTYNDVLFVKSVKRDTGLLEVICMWVSSTGKVYNDYIYSAEWLYDEALQGDTNYRKILFDVYRKFCPDAL